MGWKSACVGLGVAALLAGCQQGTEMTQEQKATAVGAAAGTGIALVAGGSFGEVVGAGLVGGAAGYLGSSMFRDPHLGR
jgi:hypothetical protein